MKIAKKDIFIIMPAYNEEGRVGQVVKEANKTGLKIFVIDDGSDDKTADEAAKNKATVIRHALNLGKGAALKTGVEAAFMSGAKAIISMDADGQHEAKHVAQFISALNKGNDIVFGSRTLAGHAPIVRYLGNKIGSFLVAILFGIYRQDILCGYLAFTKKAYKKIKWESSRYGLETELVARTGKNKLKYTEIPIRTIYIDKYKGVSIIDAINIFPSLFKWKYFK